MYKKTIRFIWPQAKICVYWSGKETVLTLCAIVKNTSMCVMADFMSVFIVPRVYPFLFFFGPYNPTMHCSRVVTPFLSLIREITLIFFSLGLIPNSLVITRHSTTLALVETMDSQTFYLIHLLTKFNFHLPPKWINWIFKLQNITNSQVFNRIYIRK